MYVSVVFNIPLFQSFTYSVPESLINQVEIGKRVHVFFGNRKTIAFIIGIQKEAPKDIPSEKIKPVLRIIDEFTLVSKELILLSQWISRYYLCSQGEALFVMIPSGKRETELTGFAFEESIEKNALLLSEEQKKAVQGILSSNGLHYLYGTTGSGKTEVFLQCAESVLAKNQGVIYLVPEIALTHQVIEAVINRFGKTAAILHSGLTPSQKLTEWKRILTLEARVVIGARSAVFAPVPDLGLIIIDEEHDSSYKSSNSPRYHARQTAIKRCTDLQIPLVMGSATPSVEAWFLMQQNRIQKHTLSQRLAGGTQPHIQIINMSTHSQDGCISKALENEINQTKKENRQTILFLNRRGFTHFFVCKSCGYEQKCKNCSVSLTFYKSQKKLRCHYCGWSLDPPAFCPECGSLDVSYSGFGTEFIENELAAKFPHLKTIRIDTDSVSKKGELEKSLTDFRNGNADILLGTQMVAKGLNFKRVKLVGVVNADTGLHVPDFRAAERTFSLIVQVSGRAGRFFPDGKVIVQTYNPERAAISYACKSDFAGFYEQELAQRQVLFFPPFSRLIRLVFRSKQQHSAQESAQSAKQILLALLKKSSNSGGIQILGPAECALSLIAGNYRFQILLRASEITPMQTLIFRFMSEYKSPSGIYVEVDVDPVNLL